MRLQLLSVDGLFAIIIFTFALLIIGVAWYGTASQLGFSSSGGNLNLENQLEGLQNRLFLQGTPSNWETLANSTGNVTWANVSIGIGTGLPGSVSRAKVMALLARADLNYNESKANLGVGYDYFITITGRNINIKIGKDPARLGATSIQAVSRAGVMDSRPVTIQVRIWTNSTFGVS